MSLAHLKAVGSDRGVVPVPFVLSENLVTKVIRSTPDGRLDLLDVAENVCSTRHAAQQAIASMLYDECAIGEGNSLVGFPVSAYSKVRWAGQKGPSDSLVAKKDVALRLLLAMPTRKGTKMAVLEHVTREMQAKLQSEQQAQQAEIRALNAEEQCKEATHTIESLQGETRALVGRIHEMEQHSSLLASVGGCDLEIQAARDRLQMLRDAEIAEEDAMCLTQLRILYKRVNVSWQTREQMSAMYLGRYAELHEHVARSHHASRHTLVAWLREHPDGRRCWLEIQARCGWTPAPYDANQYEIEHILNASWGGADHSLNYMVLPRSINNSIEFRCGPSHLKMIMLGRWTFEFVQRFARWDAKVPTKVPRSQFLNDEVHFKTESLLGMRQTTIAFPKRIRV